MKRLFCLAILFLAFCCVTVANEPIRLTIDDPAGLKADWPLTAGVPFPKGALKSEANVRLVDGAGKEAPCQVDKTATWLDGSVRWVLVSFRGRTDGDYRVEYG